MIKLIMSRVLELCLHAAFLIAIVVVVGFDDLTWMEHRSWKVLELYALSRAMIISSKESHESK